MVADGEEQVLGLPHTVHVAPGTPHATTPFTPDPVPLTGPKSRGPIVLGPGGR